MAEKRNRVLLFAGLLAACCLLCHCNARPPGPFTPESDPIDPRAGHLLETLLAANEGLESIKGLGRVKLRLDNQLNTFRAAWGGRQPDRFRLDVRVLTGQPIISFACDGDRFYLLLHQENKLYHPRATGNGLKRIISIDISVEEFLDLFCGRLPLRQEGNVRIQEGGDAGLRLVLDGRGREFFDTIFLDDDRSTVRVFERRESGGKLLYRVAFGDWRENDGYLLPESITIQDDGGQMVHVDVERAWVNPGLTDERFVLKAS